MAWVADTDNHRILNQECLILSQCRSLVTAVVMAVDSAEEDRAVVTAICMHNNLKCTAGDIRHNLRCLVEDMVVVTANSLNMEVDLAAVCKVVTVCKVFTVNHKDSRNIKMQARLAVK